MPHSFVHGRVFVPPRQPTAWQGSAILAGTSSMSAPSRMVMTLRALLLGASMLSATTQNQPPIQSFGNPNVQITSASGSVFMARTTGMVPAFLHVSASGITCGGVPVPGLSINSYEDPYYLWNFGDSGSTEIFTDFGSPPNGVSTNSNQQRGPEAVHCYRNPGTYNGTLSVYDRTGSLIATFSFQFIATAQPTGIFIDSTAPGGGNGTQANPFNDSAHILSGVATAGQCVHLKCGSVWNNPGSINNWASGVRLDSYGTGAKPVINWTTGDNDPVFMATGTQDVVISNVALNVNGGTSSGNSSVIKLGNDGNQGQQVMRFIYLDNLNVQTAIACFAVADLMPADENDIVNAARWTDTGVWGGSYVSNQAGAQASLGIYVSAYQNVFIYGTVISGGSGDNVRDHHVYNNVRYHGCYKYNASGNGPGRDFNFNTNYDNIPFSHSPPIQYAEFHCYDGNNVTGTLNGIDGGNNDNNIGETSRFRNFVIQNNSFHGLPFGPISAAIVETQTIRDNYSWNCVTDPSATTSVEVTACGGQGIKQVYRNNWYKPTGGGSPVDAGIFSFKDAAFTLPQVFTDNNIQDQRTTADLIECWNGSLASQLNSAGSLFARNKYFAPNDTNGFFPADDGSDTTFANWKIAVGTETGSSFTHGANPAWPNAANGVFF